MTAIPSTQHAVQLVGPDKLILNKEKGISHPNEHQVLCKVIVVGLCFSDLKLLKQFSEHPRKSEVLKGLEPEVLKEIPSYVPGEAPTVPGHEPVVEIVEAGSAVKNFKVGERYFVQADWRWLATTSSNAAFGYNFEGALQEYVLLDERILISPEGESMLLPAPAGERAISAFGLVEPWACAECSYQVKERTRIKEDGRMLIVSETCAGADATDELFANYGKPSEIVKVCPTESECKGDAASLDEVDDNTFDDIIYFGHNADTMEKLWAKSAKGALINLVLCGGPIERAVYSPMGDTHYRGVRLIGTTGSNPADSMKTIPARPELREGDSINVVGAAGPMGVMHVIRNLSQGVPGITLYAGDLSDERLEALSKFAAPVAEANGLGYKTYNPKTGTPDIAFNYTVVMAPIPALVAAAVENSAPGGILNLFAGIAAGKGGEMDMQAYIEKGLYLFGTSGSLMSDMKIVLGNVQSGKLDTNVSVAAIGGLDGAVDGIRRVERQEVPGKIMIYPQCKGLEITLLSELNEKLPEVAAKLADGVWTKEAEAALLAQYAEA